MRPLALELALETGRVTNPPGHSLHHGEEHWKQVAIVGFRLARETPGANLEFLFTFALLHDLMRENEYDDPQHGVRAAALFTALVADGKLEYFQPYSYTTEDMMYTLAHHVGSPHARDHTNINVGLCWDADRLTLWRVRERPKSAFLTTPAARTPEALAFGYRVCLPMMNGETLPSWSVIAEEIDQWRFP